MGRPRIYRAEHLPDSNLHPVADLVLEYLRSTLPGIRDLPPEYLRTLALSSVSRHASSGTAIVVRDPVGRLVGYGAYDVFDFHGERSAFCPITGHAAVAGDEVNVHELIYTSLAERWRRQGICRHYFQVAASRSSLEARMHELGFGGYVVDAVRNLRLHPTGTDRSGTFGPPRGISIRRAGIRDCDALDRLSSDAVAWYASSPIFLTVEPHPGSLNGYLTGDDGAVYVADRNGEILGFMGIHLVEEGDGGVLVAPGDATLDGIGAYLQPEIRNIGVGDALMQACIEWAATRGAERLHVDYESANPAARAFWPRYFPPLVHSLMRVLHGDVG